MPAAALVVRVAAARPPTLGRGRLVCVDGPAGSGKTTLADAIAGLTGATVVHMDDLYAGWHGLSDSPGQLETILRPLAAGRTGSYRRYDWHEERFAETVEVPPTPWLVVEGVGSGSPDHAALITALAWVTAPEDLRLRRGLERDGAAMEQHWRRWMRDEATLFAQRRTAEWADVLVDGTGAEPARMADGGTVS